MEKKLLEAIREHIEHWKNVNGYDCPFDYVGMLDIIQKHLINA